MANKIKGLTLEIDGDVTPLNKALGTVNTTSRELQTELRGVERLLKLDPENVDLLNQKQKILAESIGNTKDKLDVLKEAEKQVQEQFKKGDASEEQVRALQREIIKTESELGKLETSASNFQSSVAKDFKKAGESMQDFGNKVSGAGKSMSGISLAAAGVLTGLVANTEMTKEYREEMGKLETAFTTSGHSAEDAKEVYEGFYSVIGEEDRAVEAVSHLAKLTDSQEDLSKWTTIATGVYSTFGDSLPIEGLTEAANETAKTGELTGVLADALNWAGVSEDEFKAKLESTNTEKERSSLITETLNGLYAESADKYREVNAEIINANVAQSSMNDSMATLGETMQPLITEVFTMLAEKLQLVTDWIATLDETTLKMILAVVAAVAGIAPLLIIIGKVITAVGAITTALPALGTALTALTGPIGIAIAAFAAIIAVIVGLYKTNEDFRNKVDAIWAEIKEIFASTLASIQVLVEKVLGVINKLWEENGEQIMTVVTQMFELVSAIFVKYLEIIRNSLESFITLATGFWELFGEDITRIATSLWEAAKKIFSGALEVISGLLDVFVGLFTGDWERMKDGVVKIFSGLWDVVKGIVGGAWDLLKGSFKSLWDNISGWFTDLKDAAVDWGKNMIQGYIDGILSMIDKVKDATSGVVDGVKDFMGFNSPSKKGEGRHIVEWGENMVGGFIDGMQKAMPELNATASSMIPNINNQIDNIVNIDYDKIPQGNTTIYVNNPQPSPAALARQIKKTQQELALGF